METNEIISVSKNLGIKGDILGVSILSSGHINSTYKVDVDENGTRKSYIVQKINTNVFKDPEALMNNILSVTGFIADTNKSNKRINSLKFLPGENGTGLVVYDNDYYRSYEFVENSETYDITDNRSKECLVIFQLVCLLKQYQTSIIRQTALSSIKRSFNFSLSSHKSKSTLIFKLAPF